MTLEQKIGQLFVVCACPMRGDDHWADWDRLIDTYHVGGLLIKKGSEAEMRATIEKLQKLSPVPLLVMADAEWGLGMTSPSFLSYPRNMTLGAVADPALIQDMGYQIGIVCRSMGIHMNLAPVADVNNNPRNPIIHMRSFGEDPEEVGIKASAYARGLQDAGVLAAAKHFFGHGNTHLDSHISLPTIDSDLKGLHAVELAPFQKIVDEGIDAIMTGHLVASCLDSLPCSLSEKCIDLLRKELGFQGLVITDALNMDGLTAHFSTEEIARRAHSAGNDLLLYGYHINEIVDGIIRDLVPRAFSALVQLYKEETLSIKTLDQTVLRILEAKEKKSSPALIDKSASSALKKRLFEEAITLVRDENKAIPLTGSLAYIGIGGGDADLLAARFRELGVPVYSDFAQEELFKDKTVVIALHDIQPRSERYGLTSAIESAIQRLSEKTPIVLCLFGTPYALRYFADQKTVLIGYENDPDAQAAVWRVLRGEIQAKGHLPVYTN